MRALRVLRAMLSVARVPVRTGAGERRRALTDRVQMDTVQSWWQASERTGDVDPGRRLHQAECAKIPAGSVAHLCLGAGGVVAGDRERGCAAIAAALAAEVGDAVDG